MRPNEIDIKSLGPCRVQVQINNALRLALGLGVHISVEELLDRTNSLTYNQLVIQATQRLTSSIIKGDCKGLKDIFQCDLEVKRTTRSSDKGNLQPPTMKNVPSQGFRHQSAKLWNSKTSVDEWNAKLTTLQLRNYTLEILFERSGGGNCEAISDVAERVLDFSILYTHYICGGVINFDFAY
jgi:hypothetical protein